MCTVAVSYIDQDDEGVTILGDSFLREFVASFDYQTNEVTLAKSAEAPI